MQPHASLPDTSPPEGRLSEAEERFERMRRSVGLVLGPLAFFVLLAFPPAALPVAAAKLLAVVAWVLVWWITEAVPLPATAILGPALTVVLGVAPAKEAFAAFGDPIIFLFLGSFLLAGAMSAHGLDRRIARAILAIPAASSSPRRVVVTFLALSAALSMWLSNSATTAMLYPIALGTSSELRVGQKVIAIGNPFGYDRTMTIGVVSGLNRPVRTGEGRVVMNAIQTDASINPGNSGGPLLNSRGEVIGINSSIFSTSGSSQGINFAIPIDTAVEVVGELIRTGKVSRGWIDASMLQLTPRLVEYAKLPISQGVLISQLAPGGNAEKAGLKGGTRQVQYGSSIFYLGGDIIVAIDNEKVEDLNGLYLALLPKKSGEKVAVTVNRSGEVKKIDVVLIERTMSHIRALVR